ncbi:CPBP family intramembrane metalloprotease [Ruminococcaceae bacterium OttesenSCG-928-A16]|nr:CPBP family intramembrane metalloprotease [Ruminococcaceae bacterium OttesenSCG-928-A16]
MEQTGKKRKDLLPIAANWIGLAMLLYIVLSLLVRLLGGLVLQGAFNNVTLKDLTAVPEWALGIYNIVLPLAVLLPPYYLLKMAGKPKQAAPPMGKSRLPLWLLTPLFLGAMVVVNSVSSLIAGWFGAGNGPAALPKTVAGVLFYFVYTCILPPVLEERLFRGMVQGMLRPWGARFAILVSSLLFAFLHTNLSAILGVFLLSVLLGYVREITGSVRPGIILHFFNNLASLIMMLGQTYLTGVAALAFGFWVTLVFLVLFAAAAWAVWQFKWLPKFKLQHDKPPEQGQQPPAKRLLTAPVFVAGVVGTLLYFVFGAVL